MLLPFFQSDLNVIKVEQEEEQSQRRIKSRERGLAWAEHLQGQLCELDCRLRKVEEKNDESSGPTGA